MTDYVQGEQSQRMLWQKARESISVYEHQASELQLDLQQEQKELQAAKDKLASIKKETSQMRNAMKQEEAATLMEMTRMAELTRQLKREYEDTGRLANQLTSAKNKLAHTHEEQQACRKDMEEHEQAMQARITMMNARSMTSS